MMQFRVQNYSKNNDYARIIILVNHKSYPCIFNFEEEFVLVRDEGTKRIKGKIAKELSVLGWADVIFVNNKDYKKLSKKCKY